MFSIFGTLSNIQERYTSEENGNSLEIMREEGSVDPNNITHIPKQFRFFKNQEVPEFYYSLDSRNPRISTA